LEQLATRAGLTDEELRLLLMRAMSVVRSGRYNRWHMARHRTPRLGRRAWSRVEPTWVGHHVERSWLRQHWAYGARIHEESARALARALESPSEREVGHALYLKIFSEYANALEVAGAWGWAIRNRRPDVLLLDTLVSYPDQVPGEFYKAARRNRSGSLIQLLRLPSEPRVVSALREVLPDWSDDDCRRSLRETVVQARRLGNEYLAEDGVIRDIYNRVKHGAPLLHDESLTDREFWVFCPNLPRSEPDARRYLVARFNVTPRAISGAVRDVVIASEVIRYFACLAHALDVAGLLHPAGRPPIPRGAQTDRGRAAPQTP
jgi:hypothetical protein